jgi:DNA-binding LacI/PurR family transcriptional regulator
MEDSMKVTLKDIAKEAGVSVSMVSYVLNKTGRITQERHKKILDIARKYHYVPDANARGLVTGISNNIGLVINKDLESIFYQPMTSKLIGEIIKNLSMYSGWLSLCAANDLSVMSMRSYLGNVKVDGYIFLFADKADEIAELLIARRTPCIFMYSGLRNPDVGKIECDDYKGIQSACEYLISLGHQRIMFISAKSGEPDDGDIRRMAYADCVKNFHLPYYAVVRGEYTKAGSYAALKKFLESGRELPTAIVSANDKMAWGALKLLDDKGLRVPEDISVIGFDDADIEFNEDAGLSSVREPISHMAHFCVDYINECLNSGQIKGVVERIEPQLIIRKSTGAPSY